MCCCCCLVFFSLRYWLDFSLPFYHAVENSFDILRPSREVWVSQLIFTFGCLRAGKKIPNVFVVSVQYKPLKSTTAWRLSLVCTANHSHRRPNPGEPNFHLPRAPPMVEHYFILFPPPPRSKNDNNNSGEEVKEVLHFFPITKIWPRESRRYYMSFRKRAAAAAAATNNNTTTTTQQKRRERKKKSR